MPIKAILFDKDGTLVDVLRTLAPAFAAVLRELAGGDGARMQRMADAAGFDLATQTIRPGSPIAPGTPAELAACLAPALGVPADTALIVRINSLLTRETARHLTAAPGALEIVGGLKAQGFKVGVSTNAAANHARDELDRLGLIGHLDFLAGFNSGFGAKPGPGHVLAFAAAVEVPVASVACVGDSTYDLEAARRAGALPIGVLGGSAPRSELEPLAALVIESLLDLPAALDALQAA